MSLGQKLQGLRSRDLAGDFSVLKGRLKRNMVVWEIKNSLKRNHTQSLVLLKIFEFAPPLYKNWLIFEFFLNSRGCNFSLGRHLSPEGTITWNPHYSCQRLQDFSKITVTTIITIITELIKNTKNVYRVLKDTKNKLFCSGLIIFFYSWSCVVPKLLSNHS